MEPELGSINFMGWKGQKQNRHECVLTNKWRLRLLLQTKVIE